jgi:hypothetical protein
MAIAYIGSRIEMLSENVRDPHFELSAIDQVWRIAAPDFANWWANKTTGRQWAGGYIVDRSSREQGPYIEATLSIALPPDFNAVQISGTFGIQTISKTANVVNSSVIPGATSVDATRQMSFYAYSRVFKYWASSTPGGPRFTTAQIADPITLSDFTRATAAEGTPTGQKSRIYGTSLPSPLLSAMTIPIVTLLTAFDFDPIPGTPWFRCSDTVSRIRYVAPS